VLMSADGNTLAEDTCTFTLVPACTDFEDLDLGTEYGGEGSFTSGDIDFLIRKGSVAVVDTRWAGGSGKELYIVNSLLDFDFGYSPNTLTLRYYQSTIETPDATLEINGKTWSSALLSAADGLTIGGVTVSADGGTLQFDGTINSFAIGGSSLYVDDVCPR
jgi:hypothetical protein